MQNRIFGKQGKDKIEEIWKFVENAAPIFLLSILSVPNCIWDGN
jgi:hypothetical protein